MNYNNVVFETSFGKSQPADPIGLGGDCLCRALQRGKIQPHQQDFQSPQSGKGQCGAGQTATINFFRLENVRFADLPGYGYAKVAQAEKQRWSDLIETYFNSDRRIELVFQLIDMRHPPTKDDLMMVDFLIQNEFPL